MGQAASTADFACAQSCKDWGEKDYSTVKVNLESIHSLDCLKNEDPLSCLGKDDCGKDASQGSQDKDKELVTDKENAPPHGFKVPKLSLPGPCGNESSPVSMTASTAASTTASLNGKDKEPRMPCYSFDLQVTQELPQSDHQHHSQDDPNLKNEPITDPSHIKQPQAQKSAEMDAEQQLLAADLAEQQAQPKAPKGWTSESDAAAFELKVTRMGWSQSEHSLVRREVIAIPSSVDVHPHLTVADFKTLLKDQKMTLKSGEVINQDHMVLTTPRELAVGGALDDEKTLAEAGVGPKTPELLLLHIDSVRKASAGGKKPSPRAQWQEVEQKKLEAKAQEEKELAEQQMKVDQWLKSNGFKDVNDLVRKRLTKVRPLHVAVGKGDDEMVRLLLMLGADPRMCNGKNETPLLMAKRLERSGSPGLKAVVSILERRIQEGFS